MDVGALAAPPLLQAKPSDESFVLSYVCWYSARMSAPNPVERSANESGSAWRRCARSLQSVLCAAVLAAGSTHPALAWVTHADRVPAVKASVPPSSAAFFAGSTWQPALLADRFFDFTNREPAALSTQAYLLYDDRNLYVAFRCDQQNVAITADQKTDNAGVGSDDYVSFEIDTSGNGSRTYTFRSNPDGVHDESSTENARYAPSWQSMARRTASGYDVVMIVPLSDIRAAGGTQSWRINFERYVAARNADYTWAYEPAMPATDTVLFWPWLTGIRLAATAARPRPYADAYALESAGSQRNIFQNGVGQFEPMQPRMLGLDVTDPFTNTLALVGTIDPDFSNVEEDQTTIQLQEFQKTYQEYRPFFAQGAQYINALPGVGATSTNTMFYTPSIGVFNRGLKVEGTAGSNAIGALNVVGPGIDDDAAGYQYTGGGGTFAFDFEDVLANHPGVRDDTTGFAFQRLNPHSGEQTQVEFSTEADSLEGPSHDLNLTESLRNQHFTLAGYYRDTSPLYGPIDGYTAVDDARGVAAVLGYNGTGSHSGPLLSYTVRATFDRYIAHDGTLRQADINAFYDVDFKNLISVQGFAGPSELQTAPGLIQWFNRRQIQVGYADSTPQPLTLGYTWGPFGGFYVQQTQFSDVRVFGPYVLSLEYDGNIERPAPGAPIDDSQWLRRIDFSRAFGRDASLGLSLRNVNGSGGFASPGTDLSLLFQRRFADQDLLYVEFGTPAATQTLHRFIVKYVFHAGGGTGT